MLPFFDKREKQNNAVVNFLWKGAGQDRKLDYYANYGRQTLNKPTRWEQAPCMDGL